MAPFTGGDIANLHERADAHGCTWASCRTLPTPYIVDHHTRTVWVDEHLVADAYYQAVSTGLDALDAHHGATVIPFPARARRMQAVGD